MTRLANKISLISTLALCIGCVQVADLKGYSFSEGTDTQTNTNTETETGTDTNSDIDTTTHTGSNADTDTDSDTNSDTGVNCSPNAAVQCDLLSGDVHSYDSCGNDEGLVTDCHPTNALCSNLTTTTAQCMCLGNWDSANACDRCMEGFVDNANNCITAVRYVNPTIAGLAGQSWADALADIQSGIGECQDAISLGVAASCEVWVAASTYYIYFNNVSNTVHLQPEIEVYGGFLGFEELRVERDFENNITILDGRDFNGSTNKVYHVLTCEIGGLIDGFIIQHGYSGSEEPKGGGLWVKSSAAPTVRNCQFLNNRSYVGGGAIHNDINSAAVIQNCSFGMNLSEFGGGGAVYNGPGTTTVIDNCSFNNNTVYENRGGGIANDNTGLITIMNSSFQQNFGAQGGGGVSNSQSEVEIINCIFDDNSSSDSGGAAINSSASTVSITGCTFANQTFGNATAKGGAIYHSSTNATIASSVFFNNEANGMDAFGGGIYQDGGSLDVINCSFSLNNVDASDGAAYEQGAAIYVSGLVATIRNTIIQGNTPLDKQRFYTVGSGLVFFYSNVYGIDTSYNNNVDGDPLFVDAAAGDLHISDGSICIDAADGNAAPPIDKDELPRFNHPTIPNTGSGTPNYVDIGAYEFQ